MTDVKPMVNGFSEPRLPVPLNNHVADSAKHLAPNGVTPSMDNSSNLSETCLLRGEPVAIIGMSARFPGDATSVDAFWRMVMDGRSARSEVPKERYNAEAFYSQGGGKTGMV
jgi:hypothetical protein